MLRKNRLDYILLSEKRTLLDSVTQFATPSDRAILDAPGTAADLASVIRHMRATSAPGINELTAGFYQVESDVFGKCLSIVFNDRIRCGHLRCPSANRYGS